MRERTIKVDTATLSKLSEIYQGVEIARKLGVSKQLWHKYKRGLCDVPESVVDRLCDNYGLDKDKVAVRSI